MLNNKDDQLFATELSEPKYWLLRLTQACYSMSQALSLRRLAEFVQGGPSLSDSAVWLLGTWYGVRNQDTSESCMIPEVQEALLQDFKSRLWFTYRRDFPCIGSSGLTSDVGWGCTIRSGQMLLGEAFLRHVFGRHWSRTPAALQDCRLQQLLELFLDCPGSSHPFSIHSICEGGKVTGVVPGKWLGPWALCKALEACIKISEQAPLLANLRLHVVCDPGGGAPELNTKRVFPLFGAKDSGANGCCSSDDKSDVEHPSTSTTDLVTTPQANCVTTINSDQADTVHMTEPRSVLILVPLTLGLDKVNSSYFPQLLTLLSWPESCGIVGGKPSASLYFVGCQNENLLYLDPHDAQQFPHLPEDSQSFFCDTPRLLPITSMDPSVAIGFYCHTRGDFCRLCERLQQLHAQFPAAPIMTVSHDNRSTGGASDIESEWPTTPSESSCPEQPNTQQDEWEVV